MSCLVNWKLAHFLGNQEFKSPFYKFVASTNTYTIPFLENRTKLGGIKPRVDRGLTAGRMGSSNIGQGGQLSQLDFNGLNIFAGGSDSAVDAVSTGSLRADSG